MINIKDIDSAIAEGFDAAFSPAAKAKRQQEFETSLSERLRASQSGTPDEDSSEDEVLG